jgi:hypothetical protein
MRNLFITILAILVFSSFTPVKAQETALEGIGIDGIKVGRTTKKDVIRKFGKDYKSVTHDDYSEQLIYEKSGISVYYCQSDESQTIFAIQLRKPFNAVTSKGIVLEKSTVADVKRLYGKPAENEGAALWLTYKGIDFRSVDLKTDEAVLLSDEMLINEINIYAFDFKPCERKKTPQN